MRGRRVAHRLRVGYPDCLWRADHRLHGASHGTGRRQGRQQGRGLCAGRPGNGQSAAPPGHLMSNHRARSLSRRLALQALYQLQINPRPWSEIYHQYAGDEEAERVDAAYFRELFESIAAHREALDERLKPLSEILPAELDP